MDYLVSSTLAVDEKYGLIFWYGAYVSMLSAKF